VTLVANALVLYLLMFISMYQLKLMPLMLLDFFTFFAAAACILCVHFIAATMDTKKPLVCSFHMMNKICV
jgi:hypothetical protein